MDNQQEKICKNCIHYCEHYVKKKTHFMKLWRGHCLKWKNVRKNLISDMSSCEKWEKNTEVDNTVTIKKLLTDILEQLIYMTDCIKENPDGLSGK